VSAVAFYLLLRGDGTEYNFCECPAFERFVCDASKNLQRLFDYGEGYMCSIVDQARYVILGHLWQLFLKYTFKPSEYD